MNFISEKIRDHYAEKSAANCSLSCGSNLACLNLQIGEQVLDLGCGTGHEALQAALRVGDQGVVTGLDLTPEMLDTAAQNARQAGIANIEFVRGSIETLPFDNNIFDVVISNCVINHANDKKKVYQEIFRVLKQGGRFVISDVVSKNELPSFIKNDHDQWAACFGGAITEAAYLQSIREAGFADICILHKREYVKNGYDFASLTIQGVK